MEALYSKIYKFNILMLIFKLPSNFNQSNLNLSLKYINICWVKLIKKYKIDTILI